MPLSCVCLSTTSNTLLRRVIQSSQLKKVQRPWGRRLQISDPMQVCTVTQEAALKVSFEPSMIGNNDVVDLRLQLRSLNLPNTCSSVSAITTVSSFVFRRGATSSTSLLESSSRIQNGVVIPRLMRRLADDLELCFSLRQCQQTACNNHAYLVHSLYLSLVTAFWCLSLVMVHWYGAHQSLSAGLDEMRKPTV